jgi:hypothetical protein
MVDLDDFDPMGKQWDHAHQDFSDNGSDEQVADEALRVAAAMLRACGGCSILPQLQECLWEYYQTISSHTLWSPTLKEADAALYEKLDLLSQVDLVCDKRIETIAIRSTKRMALQLREQHASSERPIQLQTKLATLIIKDLIGHSFLDLSRAMSVGKRFTTPEQAFQFYDEVMKCIESGAVSIGRRLARKPNAERLQRYRIIKSTHTTRSMLYDKEFSCEL